MSFVWHSPVFFDELDLNGTLLNSRFAVHVERAQSALFERLGKQWSAYDDRDPDLHYVVKELHVE
jgi:acyl-CoA thioester hydrolase